MSRDKIEEKQRRAVIGKVAGMFGIIIALVGILILSLSEDHHVAIAGTFMAIGGSFIFSLGLGCIWEDTSEEGLASLNRDRVREHDFFK